jgi:hypothetical protein
VTSFSFSGSYDPEDVVFLLKTIKLLPTPQAERERRIQAGLAHYSEMIGEEGPPSAAYLRVFHESVERDGPVMAERLAALASLIAARRRGPVTLVSLARAGTPVGILLGRILRRYFHRDARHYSISVIRDRGIDAGALNYLLRERNLPAESIVFVDGWTAKGRIAGELSASVERYNRETGAGLPSDLHVLTDLCGEAGVAPGREDFLIPSCILGGIVSGLISRTVLNAGHTGPGDFHGCVYYGRLAPHDLSRFFADRITEEVERLDRRSPVSAFKAEALSEEERRDMRREGRAFVERIVRAHNLPGADHVKPGLGEATRVLLRRSPGAVLLRSPDEPETRHLRILAEEKNVPILHDPALPYRAAALIKVVDHV